MQSDLGTVELRAKKRRKMQPVGSKGAGARTESGDGGGCSCCHRAPASLQDDSSSRTRLHLLLELVSNFASSQITYPSVAFGMAGGGLTTKGTSLESIVLLCRFHGTGNYHWPATLFWTARWLGLVLGCGPRLAPSGDRISRAEKLQK